VSAEWVKYAVRRPETAGVYRWRVPHQAIKGVVVEVSAEMGMRGAGYKNVLSPEFDHWDGRTVRVPPGTEWLADPVQRGIEIVGHPLAPCRWCGKHHAIDAMLVGLSGGVMINPGPHELNHWMVTACAWAKSPAYRDPCELIREWNSRHAGGTTKESI